jgi:hypothetical protein
MMYRSLQCSPFTALLAIHCTARHSLHCSPFTALLAIHCTARHSLHYSPFTALLAIHCTTRHSLHCSPFTALLTLCMLVSSACSFARHSACCLCSGWYEEDEVLMAQGDKIIGSSRFYIIVAGRVRIVINNKV